MKRIKEKTKFFLNATSKANKFLLEKSSKKQILLIVFLMVATSQSWVVTSWFFAESVNKMNSAPSVFKNFPLYAVVLVVFFVDIFFESLKYIKNFFQRKINFIFKEKVQKVYWQAFIKYDLQDRENKKMQDALENASKNQNAVADIYENQLYIAIDIVTICTASIALISIHWWYVLAIFFIAAPRLIFTWKRKNKEYEQDKRMREIDRYTRSLSSFLSTKEAVVNQVKKGILELFDSSRRNNQKISLRRRFFFLRINFFSNCWFFMIDALLLFSLLYSISMGTIPVGTIFIFYSSFGRLYSSLNDVTEKIMDFGVVAKRVEDFFLVVDGVPAVTDSKNSILLDVQKSPLIEFRDVSFKYPESDAWILKNCSFRICQGERVGIVARNGEGKTTIMLLLLRFYDVTEGGVFINGENIKNIKRESIFSITSILFQDFSVIEGSIRFGLQSFNLKKRYSDEELWDAIEKVKMKEYVEKLPFQLNQKMSKIFSDSRKFSGGQLQKIGIAGTLLRDSKLLILDEFTSALDPLAEADIVDVYSKITQGKTCLIISHRYTALNFVDKIILLQEGKIVEQGSKKELLAKKDGIFKEMYNAYVSLF